MDHHVRVGSADEAVVLAQSAGGTVLAGPLDALPAGRLAVLRRPRGRAVLRLGGHAREGAQLVNEYGAWSMSMLHTPDPARAEAFYGAMFGWQAEPFGRPKRGSRSFACPDMWAVSPASRYRGTSSR